jgi:hypothetical protein
MQNTQIHNKGENNNLKKNKYLMTYCSASVLIMESILIWYNTNQDRNEDRLNAMIMLWAGHGRSEQGSVG